MRKTLFIFFILISSLNVLKAQNTCQFQLEGTLGEQKITICFYPDNDDGYVSGHYYYEEGRNGNLQLDGTAIYSKGLEGYYHRLTEYNSDGQITGYFIGTFKDEVMEGTWTNPSGNRSYHYRLELKK